MRDLDALGLGVDFRELKGRLKCLVDGTGTTPSCGARGRRPPEALRARPEMRLYVFAKANPSTEVLAREFVRRRPRELAPRERVRVWESRPTPAWRCPAAGDGSGRLYVAEKSAARCASVEGGGAGSPAPLSGTSLCAWCGRARRSRGCWAWPSTPANARTATSTSELRGHGGAHRRGALPARRRDAQRHGRSRAAPCPLLRVEQPEVNHNGTGHRASSGRTDLPVRLPGRRRGRPATRTATPRTRQSLLPQDRSRLDVDRTEVRDRAATPSRRTVLSGTGRLPAGGLGAGPAKPWRYSFEPPATCTSCRGAERLRGGRTSSRRARRPGSNFGWPRMEATHCYPSGSACDRQGLTLPAPSTAGAATAPSPAAAVYRGTAQPLLRGAYLFGDYCSGRIWSLHARDGGARRDLGADRSCSDSEAGVSSFGEDEAGELYLTGLSDGVLYRDRGGAAAERPGGTASGGGRLAGSRSGRGSTSPARGKSQMRA